MRASLLTSANGKLLIIFYLNMFLPVCKISLQCDFRTDFESHCAATSDLQSAAAMVLVAKDQKLYGQMRSCHDRGRSDSAATVCQGPGAQRVPRNSHMRDPLLSRTILFNFSPRLHANGTAAILCGSLVSRIGL
jgi:hypothetical protein